MKTSFRPFLLVLFTILLSSCSNNDDQGTDTEIPTPSENALEFVNNGSGGENILGNIVVYSIDVDENRILTNPNQLFMEFNVSHAKAGDVYIGYRPPNSETVNILVYGLGGENSYSGTNTLRFNPLFAAEIQSELGVYDGNTIPSGNYKSGTAYDSNDLENPLFDSIDNENIQGTWKFYFEDVDGTLEVEQIKLIFNEDAFEQ